MPECYHRPADPSRRGNRFSVTRHTQALTHSLPGTTGILPVPAGASSHSRLTEGELRHSHNMASLKSHQNRGRSKPPNSTPRVVPNEHLLGPGLRPGSYVVCGISSPQAPGPEGFTAVSAVLREGGPLAAVHGPRVNAERSRWPTLGLDKREAIHSFSSHSAG